MCVYVCVCVCVCACVYLQYSMNVPYGGYYGKMDTTWYVWYWHNTLCMYNIVVDYNTGVCGLHHYHWHTI